MEFRRILRRLIDGVPVKLNQLSIDDPLASKVGWSAMESGGNSYRTHTLQTVSPGRIEFQISGMVWLVRYFFLALGGGYLFLLLMMVRLFQREGVIYSFVFGMSFMGIMILSQLWRLMLWNELVVIDNDSGFWWKGKISPREDETLFQKGKAGALSDIHAIQLLTKNVSVGKNRYAFESVELNLVSHDGSRFNLVDHGGKSMVEDAECLADFLGVPVWEGRKWNLPLPPKRQQFGRLSS